MALSLSSTSDTMHMRPWYDSIAVSHVAVLVDPTHWCFSPHTDILQHMSNIHFKPHVSPQWQQVAMCAMQSCHAHGQKCGQMTGISLVAGKVPDFVLRVLKGIHCRNYFSDPEPIGWTIVDWVIHRVIHWASIRSRSLCSIYLVFLWTTGFIPQGS